MATIQFDREEVLQAIDAVARQTMNMDMPWDWPCGVAYYGLCEAARATGREEYLQLIKQGYRIAAVYGRDWHRPSNIEYAVTELAIEGALNVENALEAIRRGRTAIIQNDREILVTPERREV